MAELAAASPTPAQRAVKWGPSASRAQNQEAELRSLPLGKLLEKRHCPCKLSGHGDAHCERLLLGQDISLFPEVVPSDLRHCVPFVSVALKLPNSTFAVSVTPIVGRSAQTDLGLSPHHISVFGEEAWPCF